MNDLEDLVDEIINSVSPAELIKVMQGYNPPNGKWKTTTKKKKASKKKIHKEVLDV